MNSPISKSGAALNFSTSGSSQNSRLLLPGAFTGQFGDRPKQFGGKPKLDSFFLKKSASSSLGNEGAVADLFESARNKVHAVSGRFLGQYSGAALNAAADFTLSITEAYAAMGEMNLDMLHHPGKIIEMGKGFGYLGAAMLNSQTRSIVLSQLYATQVMPYLNRKHAAQGLGYAVANLQMLLPMLVGGAGVAGGFGLYAYRSSRAAKLADEMSIVARTAKVARLAKEAGEFGQTAKTLEQTAQLVAGTAELTKTTAISSRFSKAGALAKAVAFEPAQVFIDGPRGALRALRFLKRKTVEFFDELTPGGPQLATAEAGGSSLGTVRVFETGANRLVSPNILM
jgi:hypothetical protein